MLNGKSILITGGTGSFGKEFTKALFTQYQPEKVIIFSRDEFKQYEMARVFPTEKYPIRYFLGDVRDRYRLYRAFQGVDYVIHAAALKQVPALEYNPIEAVKTNVVGADNIVDAAIDAGVKKVVALSTDKAVNPVNLYGATKLTAEKIFQAARDYGGGRVSFSVVRYGNVVGSRGSVIPYFNQLKQKGVREFPLTDERMTRFWITLKQACDLVFKALEISVGGEVFVPQIPSMRIVDLATAMDPECTFKRIGIRPGEKIHEALISEHESRNARICDGFYVLLPQSSENHPVYKPYDAYPVPPENFEYRSDNNSWWLSIEDLREILEAGSWISGDIPKREKLPTAQV